MKILSQHVTQHNTKIDLVKNLQGYAVRAFYDGAVVAPDAVQYDSLYSASIGYAEKATYLATGEHKEFSSVGAKQFIKDNKP